MPDRYGFGMHCPACAQAETRVVDSRAADDGAAIRRRRECVVCQRRFTTFERVEEVRLVVVKRSGHRTPFDREKIIGGVTAAAKGRPIDVARMHELAAEVEESFRLSGGEVSSEQIGRAVLDRLRPLDEVAALRFASVYKGFADAADFERELRLIKPDAPSLSIG